MHIIPHTERDLQNDIVAYINLTKADDVAFIIENKGEHCVTRTKGKLAFHGSVRPGTPDITVHLKNGEALWFEVKKHNGALTQKQKWFFERANRYGTERAFLVKGNTMGHFPKEVIINAFKSILAHRKMLEDKFITS